MPLPVSCIIGPRKPCDTTVIAVAQDGSAAVYPGSRFGFKRQVRVQVGVLVTFEHAALLFKPGNQVQIEGQMDCMIFTQGGEVVNQTVARLDAEFAQREQQGFKSDQQRNEAVRAYRRGRQQLLSAARPFVMVGYVDALTEEAGRARGAASGARGSCHSGTECRRSA